MALQDGIYWDVGATPGSAWGVLFLRVRHGADASAVDGALRGLAAVYAGLRRGEIEDLPGVELPAMDLTVLLGYGPKAFALTDTRRPLPTGLGAQFQFTSPAAAGGGQFLPGSALRYAPGLVRNPATEEVLVQAIAGSPLAVARVFVETQKFLDGHVDPHSNASPLEIAAGFTGFNREDRRSWIDFHDGVSNLRSGPQRRGVVEIENAGTPVVDRWTVGGSYLAFIRLSVDLAAWNTLTLAQQELAVGRSKVTGCPLDRVDADGTALAVVGCPVAGTGSATDPGNVAYLEPPATGVGVLQQSHVQRANHHLGPTERESSNRIFRQGYEFLDPPGPGRALVAGLNFVSFQDSLRRLFAMLTLDTWLGDTNFGGPADALPTPLLHVMGAGVYLCPPEMPEEDYPGQSIFVGE